MSEEVQLYLDDTKDKMNLAVSHLEKELLKIRAGKASPQVLDGVFVDYYGDKTLLSQMSSINTLDHKTLVVQPWDKTSLGDVEKAILAANIGITPQNTGEVIRLVIPALTEERRKQYVKLVKTEGENAKVGVRNLRREIMEELKKLKKEGIPEDEIKVGEDEAQKVTDSFIKKIDGILEKKEKEIMTI